MSCTSNCCQEVASTPSCTMDCDSTEKCSPCRFTASDCKSSTPLRGPVLLVHASVCTRLDCTVPGCLKMKASLSHGAVCTVRAVRGCTICRRLWALLLMHARRCTTKGNCPVPRCKDLKNHLQQLRDEHQRTAAASEKVTAWSPSTAPLRKMIGKKRLRGGISVDTTVRGRSPRSVEEFALLSAANDLAEKQRKSSMLARRLRKEESLVNAWVEEERAAATTPAATSGRGKKRCARPVTPESPRSAAEAEPLFNAMAISPPQQPAPQQPAPCEDTNGTAENGATSSTELPQEDANLAESVPEAVNSGIKRRAMDEKKMLYL